MRALKKNEPKALLKFYPTEQVEILAIKRTKKGYRYAVTNYGRVIKFQTIPNEGEFMKQFRVSANYPCVYLHNGDKRETALIHRLVALNFLSKPKRDQVFVLHKDRDKNNNHASNLTWANKQEHLAHAMAGEPWKKATLRARNAKLTEDRVRMIRKKLASGKTRMKLVAKQFGISEMQLYRIKSGENWGWVK